MGLFRRKKKKRICVVGLDGVPYSLLRRFTRDGTTPALAEIINKGTLSKMSVTLPEISSVSWSSFMTGANPGTHGIFGFIDIKENSYKMSFPSFKDLKTGTFWDKLAKKGKRCIVINQPSTYPARPINGVLISGFVAIDINKAVVPLTYKEKLQSMGYQIDIDTQRAREDYHFLFKELDKTTKGREKAVDFLWDKEDWDYFQVVITGTDRLHHFLWDALLEEGHPYHQNFLDYYKKIDNFVKRIFDRFEEETKRDNSQGEFFMLSDHGFTLIKKEVYLNRWLEEQGYLAFSSPNPESIADITDRTKAFALDPSRIYFNLKGKYPNGSVDKSEAQLLKEDIRTKLEGLTLDGEKVIKKVFSKEEIYSGPYTEQGPDIVVLSNPGFDLKGSVSKKEVFGKTKLAGMHTYDDAFFYSLEKPKDDLCITDLADIIMKKFE